MEVKQRCQIIHQVRMKGLHWRNQANLQRPPNVHPTLALVRSTRLRLIQSRAATVSPRSTWASSPVHPGCSTNGANQNAVQWGGINDERNEYPSRVTFPQQMLAGIIRPADSVARGYNAQSHSSHQIPFSRTDAQKRKDTLNVA